MKRLVPAFAALALFACTEPSESTKARAIEASPLEQANKPVAPGPGSKPAAAPGVVTSSSSKPGAPAPAPKPVAPPEPQGPSLLTCVKFPQGITVIDSDEALAKLAREDAPMSDGCPPALPPSGINFKTLNLVLAHTMATCNGEIAPSKEGFMWSQWGDCERAQVLKSSKLVGKAEAKKQKLIKVEKL